MSNENSSMSNENSSISNEKSPKLLLQNFSLENISKDLNSKNETPGSSSKNFYELEEKLNLASD
ncbi:1005_t:CDS:1, partial [Funneliformis geosporum]